MRIAVLTSSRADFGIYLPLLKRMKDDSFFEVKIIVFGTHLSSAHGNTIDEITGFGFEVSHTVESMLLTDSANAISTSMGLTMQKFADFWKDHSQTFDLVFCLGDRFEMFAAVAAGIPFNVRFAHIHGGETSLGATDNIFRHSITMASRYHFVSTKEHGKKVAELLGAEEGIFYVGALGLDNIESIVLLSLDAFRTKWGIDLSNKTILLTFHPETVAIEKNESYIDEIIRVIKDTTDYQVLITMPNADTMGSLIRRKLNEAFVASDRVFLVENLGTISYFTAMKYCSFLLGNTSSGIIEAASFGRYVINIGDRQKGRIGGKNIIHSPVNYEDMMKAISIIEHSRELTGNNLYYNGGASNRILLTLKELFGNVDTR